MVKVPKDYKPNSKALPPLLNRRKEKKRLISIAKEQAKLEEDNRKTERLNKLLKGERDKVRRKW